VERRGGSSRRATDLPRSSTWRSRRCYPSGAPEAETRRRPPSTRPAVLAKGPGPLRSRGPARGRVRRRGAQANRLASGTGMGAPCDGLLAGSSFRRRLPAGGRALLELGGPRSGRDIVGSGCPPRGLPADRRPGTSRWPGGCGIDSLGLAGVPLGPSGHCHRPDGRRPTPTGKSPRLAVDLTWAAPVRPPCSVRTRKAHRSEAYSMTLAVGLPEARGRPGLRCGWRVGLAHPCDSWSAART
jgi:hypothetical protein